MKLLNYVLKENDDGTYELNYNYADENGNTFNVNAPRVCVDYIMEPLKNKENIIFPNIHGCTVLEGYTDK